jgi:hypothetical protein
MPSPTRSFLSILVAALLLSQPLFAFDSHLSDEAIRNAYFLGQRHDGTFSKLFDQYAKALPAPKSGPYISSIEFLTPFVQLVQFSDAYIGNYSAQQAVLDHQAHQEFVKILVHIRLTPSYGAVLAQSDEKGKILPQQTIRRPYDFWKDFQVQVSAGKQLLTTSSVQGTPESACARRGPCTLTGATIELDFPADAFNSDTATILVTPPQGDPVSVDFDLLSFR